MSVRLVIIVSALLIILGIMPFMFHEASKPGIYTASTQTATLSWTDGPDVKLNISSLAKLNAEVAKLIEPDLKGAPNPFRIVPAGHRKAGIMIVGSVTPPLELENKVKAYVQNRLLDVAREQVGH